MGVGGATDSAGRIGDIALVHLDQPVTTLRPALIAPARAGATTREIGWGITKPPAEWGEHQPAPSMLSQIDVPIVDRSECAGSGIGTGELCMGVPAAGGGACNGDSGSAAMQAIGDRRWDLLVGSASRGPDDTCGVHPMVHTSTGYFLPWMLRTVFGLPAGASTAGKQLADARS